VNDDGCGVNNENAYYNTETVVAIFTLVIMFMLALLIVGIVGVL
jgi:hypothetical protein